MKSNVQDNSEWYPCEGQLARARGPDTLCRLVGSRARRGTGSAHGLGAGSVRARGLSAGFGLLSAPTTSQHML